MGHKNIEKQMDEGTGMSKNCPWKRSQELEIDLSEMLQGFLGKWRQILICAFAAAVLAGGYGLFADRSSSDALELFGAQEAGLSLEEQNAVEEAVELDWKINEWNEYLENSALMQINPFQCSYSVSLYSIDGITDSSQAKIIESYLNFLANGGAVHALKQYDKAEWGMEERYLGELISAWAKTDGANPSGVNRENTAPVIYVQVAGKDSKITRRLAEDIQAVLKDYSSFVKKACGSHKLSLVSSEESTKIDRNLQAQQNEKKSALKTDKMNLKVLTDAFSTQQWNLYENTSGTQKREEDNMTEKDNTYTSDFCKYLIFGFAGGIFVCFFIYAVWYVLHDTIKSAGEFRSYYTIPLYGSISFSEKRKDKAGQKGAYEKEIEKVLNRLKLVCEKKEISNIALSADFVLDNQEQECIRDIAAQIRPWGIEASVIENVCEDLDGWNKAAESGNILMMCRTGTTTRRIIDEEMEICAENGMNVMGAVMIENRVRHR